MRTFAQGGAFEGDDTLIALAVRSLVDGKGKMTRTLPTGDGNFAVSGVNAAQLGRIEIRIAAHLAGAGHIDDHHLERPGAAGLHREDAVIFDRARQQGA